MDWDHEKVTVAELERLLKIEQTRESSYRDLKGDNEYGVFNQAIFCDTSVVMIEPTVSMGVNLLEE